MTVPHSNCNSTMFSHSGQCPDVQVSENNAVTRITLSFLELILKPENLSFHVSCDISRSQQIMTHTPMSCGQWGWKYPFSTASSQTGRANKWGDPLSLELTRDARQHSELPLPLKNLSVNDRIKSYHSAPSSLVPFIPSWLNSLKFMRQGRTEGVYIKLDFK